QKDMVAKALQCFTQQLFIVAIAVDACSIQVIVTQVESAMQDRLACGVGGLLAIGPGQGHATQANGSDKAITESALLMGHRCVPFVCSWRQKADAVGTGY